MVHDEIVNFRNADRFEEDKLSIKAKSLGHILRVSGIISLLREAVMKNNYVHGYSFQNLVVKENFIMAKELVNHYIQTCFTLLSNDNRSSKTKSVLSKQSIPEPENKTVEFLIPHKRFVQRLLQGEEVQLSRVSRDNIYPVINKEKGALVAMKFVQGICKLGFGKIDGINKQFKRYLPTDADCPDKENLPSKLRKLDIKGILP